MDIENKPFWVGTFVVGGLLLMAISVALFGGADLLKPKNYYVAYFEEDTKGLRQGASVLLNGVRVGSVQEVALVLQADSFETVSRVTIELLPDNFLVAQGNELLGSGSALGQVDYEQLVYVAGARAKLDIQSFVTGQLIVQLVLLPSDSPMLTGIRSEYPEIPTVPSNARVVIQNIEGWLGGFQEELDGQEIAKRMSNILSGLDTLVNSPDLREALVSLNSLLGSEATQGLDENLESTLHKIASAADDTSRLMRTTELEIPALAAAARTTLGKMNNTLDDGAIMLRSANKHLQGNTPLSRQVQSTLREVESASRATRELAEYLEQNPEAILRGKSND